jgi:hypothetical protein
MRSSRKWTINPRCHIEIVDNKIVILDTRERSVVREAKNSRKYVRTWDECGLLGKPNNEKENQRYKYRLAMTNSVVSWVAERRVDG